MAPLTLIFFSVLSQAAAGIVLVTAFLPGPVAARIAPPLAALGLAVSLAHLGTPGGAYRALANLRSSWLSREVLLTGLFALAAALYAYAWPGRAAGMAAGLLGLAALFAQGMVYQLPARPEWRHGAGVWGLFASALLLGSLTVALAAGHGPGALRALGVVTLAASAFSLLALALWARHLVRAGHADLLGDTWFWVRLVAGIILPALAGVSMLLGLAPDLLTTGGALAGAVVGELLGRSLFYRAGLERMPQF